MLAIITARGGSKGIPGKNIKSLAGKPLIVYTIEAAMKSKYIDRIVLSTDDKKIAEIAAHYGVEIPFFRPPELATDISPTIDTLIYTIDRLQSEENVKISEFLLLQPTSPLRTADDIDNAIKIYHDRNADSILSVTKLNHSPHLALKIKDNGAIEKYIGGEMAPTNRQQNEKAYMINGAIYIFNYSLIKNNHTYFGEKTLAYIMPKERSIDIDDPVDFEFAEYILTRNK